MTERWVKGTLSQTVVSDGGPIWVNMGCIVSLKAGPSGATYLGTIGDRTLGPFEELPEHFLGAADEATAERMKRVFAGIDKP